MLCCIKCVNVCLRWKEKYIYMKGKSSEECLCEVETRENYLINIMETNNRNINKQQQKNIYMKTS